MARLERMNNVWAQKNPLLRVSVGIPGHGVWLEMVIWRGIHDRLRTQSPLKVWCRYKHKGFSFAKLL